MTINFNEIKTKSNLISLIRLLLAIPLWFLFDGFFSPRIRIIIIIVCVVAAITDALDGYLARKNNNITEFGKIIDPLADKVIIGVVIIRLFLIGKINALYLLLILSRDLLIFAGGIFIAQKLKKILPSNILGKITVTNIGVVIFLIIINLDKNNILFKILYNLSIVLIIISIIGYAYRAIEFIKKKDYGNI